MVHLTQKQIKDYCTHQLPGADVLAVTDHLGACESCRAQIEAVGNGDAAFFGLRTEVFEEAIDSGAHLTLNQTAAYVDRDLIDEELQVVDDHLLHCEECVVAVNDLRAFRNEIAPSLDREYRPVTVPSPVQTPSQTWLGSLLAPFRVSPVPAFGGAALAILLLAVIVWFVWSKSQQQPQLANTSSPVPPASSPPHTASPVLPEAAAPVVAQLNDGANVVSLDHSGKLSGADQLPPAYQELLKKTLSSGRIEKSSQLQGLTRPPSSLMGSDNQKNEFAVIEPLGNVLLTNTPTFRWSPMEGATGYVVEVYDEKFNPVISSPQLTDLEWTTILQRGKVYSWQVKAIKDGQEVTSPRPPAPQAKFRVLDLARANELAQARRAHASSHLTLGLLYADAGLLPEAEQEFRLLQKTNPNSDLARNLLRQVQALRR
ncbi:MAG TPA: zf-HC2 domain-containing protein [Pyrinomonadaceae bacterium]|nr:zf-HC2 domain-containing protein [Pyrinomonadaceae bacterium]